MALWRGSIPLRLGLIGLGLVAIQAAGSLWTGSGAFWRPATLAPSVAVWAFGMACFILAMLSHVPPRAAWLLLIGLLGWLWIFAYLQWQTTTPFTTWRTDNEMIGEYAAAALKQGANPYSWNFSDATRVYRDPGVLYTYFLDGSRQNRVTYPALPTLVLLAFGSIGWGQARLVSLVFHSILLILLFLGTPQRFRPLFALAPFAMRVFLGLVLTGIQDVVWSTLLVAMVLAWKRPTLRAVLFGLACAYRQQPWLLAPFLLIQLWHADGEANDRRARILHFVGVSLGVFLLINLPFILLDPRGWALGVFEPTYAAFNVVSHGLGALAQYGLFRLPRLFFTVLQVSLLALMIAVHWRHPRSLGVSFWIFPAIFFWAFYRGLTNYWLYWIPPLLVALTHHDWSQVDGAESTRRWRKSMVLIAAVLSANLALAAFFLTRPPAVSASVIEPLQSADSRTIYRLTVSVANHSAEAFRPRFAVQHDGIVPLPWDIQSGPEVLKRGEQGAYVISSYAHPFWIANGAQLVVSDAGGDYTLRDVADISADPSFTSADLIVNPSFTIWLPQAQTPAGWSQAAPDGATMSVRSEPAGAKTAVVLSATEGEARLSQTVTFPAAFSIQVHPTVGGTDPLVSAYGLELDDGQHRLWVLFGDRAGRGMLADGTGYVYREAALNQWSGQDIDPARLYASFGWDLPPYTLRDSQGLEFAARQVKFSLLVSGSHAEGAFGPIVQDPRSVSAEALVADAIAHPDVYYVKLGDEYRRQRNDDLAAGAYRQAIAYNGTNPYAHYGLGLALANNGQCVEAQQEIGTALNVDPGILDPGAGIIQCR